MVEIPVELRFKGERNYLHGTDVYTSAVIAYATMARDRWALQFFVSPRHGHPLLALLDAFQNGRPNSDELRTPICT